MSQFSLGAGDPGAARTSQPQPNFSLGASPKFSLTATPASATVTSGTPATTSGPGFGLGSNFSLPAISSFPASSTTFTAPSTTFAAPSTTFSTPSTTTSFPTPSSTFPAPTTTFAAPGTTFSVPSTTFSATSTTFSAPSTTFSAPSTTFSAPSTTFSAPSTQLAASSTTFQTPSTTFPTSSTTFSTPSTAFTTSTTTFPASLTSTSALAAPTAATTGQTTLATSTSVTNSSAASASSLNFCQLEEAINKWTLELEEQEKLFMNQASQVNAWDRLLIANGEKIINLNNAVEQVKLEQQQLDHELDFILGQQRELEDLLTPLEKELETNSVSDPEREHTYQLAENLDTQLKQMSEDLKEIVEHINETNRSQDNTDPIVQIGRILNAHMNSLQWIDQNTTLIGSHLDQVAKLHEVHRRENERSFRLTYD
ncbi:hypothetical protein R5R35_010509 [Gryllus longicercus]|uniref:Nucleoporin NSP1-like C-terminal domain-containing protein n=1 Tax=Gryllus longicercus TaxID=2509291 RepID=A0AAN9Z0K5_9ORTH